MSTYPSTNPRKRSVGMKVSMTEQLHADLVVAAEAIGQTPATAASFAIGQWVAQQKRTHGAADLAVSSLVEQIAPDLRAAFAQAAKSA